MLCLVRSIKNTCVDVQGRLSSNVANCRATSARALRCTLVGCLRRHRRSSWSQFPEGELQTHLCCSRWNDVLGFEAVPRRFFGAQKSRASPANWELCSWSRLKDHRHQMASNGLNFVVSWRAIYTHTRQSLQQICGQTLITSESCSGSNHESQLKRKQSK